MKRNKHENPNLNFYDAGLGHFIRMLEHEQSGRHSSREGRISVTVPSSSTVKQGEEAVITVSLKRAPTSSGTCSLTSATRMASL